MSNCFSTYNKDTSKKITQKLEELYNYKCLPVFVCIGSDLAIGDSLAPIIGSKIRKAVLARGGFLYGTLEHTVTAKEVKCLNNYLTRTHPEQEIFVIDAAVGDEGDIGNIKISEHGIYPGLGVDKKLSLVGNKSIIGIVAERSIFNYSLFNLTRLNLIYNMAETIAEGILDFLDRRIGELPAS